MLSCDSVVVVDLTILYPTDSTITVASCNSYTTPSGNDTYTTSGTYMDTIPNAVGCDSVLTINLILTSNTSGTDVQSTCFSYTWIDGNTYIHDNNTATFTLPNSTGCDSVVTLDLTINTFNRHIAIGANNDYLKATEGYNSYQWVDCDNGFAPISGATDAQFTPNQNGNYAVIMEYNSCTDTSECKTLDNVGLSNENLDHLSIYPNPTSSQVTVTLSNNEQITNIRVLDMAGKEVQNKSINNSSKININIHGNRGVYIIEVTTQNNQVIRRRISKLD
jgi:hypothetical protein